MYLGVETKCQAVLRSCYLPLTAHPNGYIDDEEKNELERIA